jgi:hypothetical protein
MHFSSLSRSLSPLWVCMTLFGVRVGLTGLTPMRFGKPFYTSRLAAAGTLSVIVPQLFPLQLGPTQSNGSHARLHIALLRLSVLLPCLLPSYVAMSSSCSHHSVCDSYSLPSDCEYSLDPMYAPEYIRCCAKSSSLECPRRCRSRLKPSR